MADTQQDARKVLEGVLSQYQLQALAPKVWELLGRGSITQDTSPDTIGFLLQDTEEYKKRFPGNVQLAAAGKATYSVSQYIDMEDAYKAAMQGAGIPQGFYDSPDDFGQFIAGGTSPAEVKRRVDQGYAAVKQANPEVIRQMKELYGVGEGELAAYFLDPVRGEEVIVRQAEAAKLGARAAQAGVGVGAQQLEELAATGITEQQAQAGFAKISQEQGLYQPMLLGEEGQISQAEQIGATFGTNEAARQRIETRRRQRQAAFEQGGSFATSQTGIAGLTTA